MCVRLNSNKFDYDKAEVNQNNINKSEQSVKNNHTKKVEILKESEQIKDNSSTQKVATANFSPKGINFGVSIFSSELGNTKKSNISQSNIKQIKIPETIGIETGIRYKLIKGGEKTLKGDVKSLTYEKFVGDKDTKTTLRAEISDPKKIKISTLYKEGNESIEKIIANKNPIVLINGTFRAGAKTEAQGNIKGENLSNNSIVTHELKGNKAASEGRAFFGITKDNKLEIGKGGKLDDKTNSKYQYLMSGLGLLASNEKNNFKTKEEFYTFIKNNNDTGTILNIFRISKTEDPKTRDKFLFNLINDYKKSHPEEYKKLTRDQIIDKVIKKYPYKELDEKLAPRSAIGITKDNKLITLTVGHGEKRYGEFASVYECYKSLKDLGAVSMAMLDGGGATFKVINGKLEEKPEASSGYANIPSAICIGCK
ncbi:MAG: phosphodiester glycosidase family protein [Candidatus Sericytochromatia bacterium]